MQNSESLQMIKEQLKIKSVELRKATEEKGKVSKKFKDLASFNRDETAKLKKELKKVKEEAEIQKRQAVTATRLAKQSGIEAGKIEAEKVEAAKSKEEELKIAKQLEKKINQKVVKVFFNYFIFFARSFALNQALSTLGPMNQSAHTPIFNLLFQ